MKVPTKEQLEAAVEAAERMYNRDIDPHYLAHCLLYFRERAGALEQLLLHADRFLRFGMNESELGAMRRLVARLRGHVVDEQDSTRDTLPF